MKFYRAALHYPQVVHTAEGQPLTVSREVLAATDFCGVLIQSGHDKGAKPVGLIIRTEFENDRVIGYLQMYRKPPYRGTSLSCTYHWKDPGVVTRIEVKHLALLSGPALKTYILEEITALQAVGHG